MLAEDLRRGLQVMGQPLNDRQQANLLAYLELLQHWNRRFNLTAVRDLRSMLIRHVFDSLVVLPHVDARRAIDVGTGGGLPGIPLAIAAPQREFTLLDSNGKKTRFLTQVKTQLGLDNVQIIHERVERVEGLAPFEMILSRAFASLDDMIDGCRHILAPGGEFLALKGRTPEEELTAISSRVVNLSVQPLSVPELEEERCLVRFSLS